MTTCFEKKHLFPPTDDDARQINPRLLANEQTIDVLFTVEYWNKLCPWLTCSENNYNQVQILSHCHAAMKYSRPTMHAANILSRELVERGYFKVEAEDLCVPPLLCEALALGAMRLVAHGHPPVALLAYDEAWALGKATEFMQPASGGNLSMGDWYVFYVGDDFGYSPGPPHRDRPMAGPESFREQGTPKYSSVWLSLTHATPETSCLYCLPRPFDPLYDGPGDKLEGTMPTPLNWQNIVALPLAPGGILGFSHRLLHWGSNRQPALSMRDPARAARPRIALNLAYADPDFEAPYFSTDQLPFPPLGLRIALASSQEIQYAHLSKLDIEVAAIHKTNDSKLLGRELICCPSRV